MESVPVDPKSSEKIRGGGRGGTRADRPDTLRVPSTLFRREGGYRLSDRYDCSGVLQVLLLLFRVTLRGTSPVVVDINDFGGVGV